MARRCLAKPREISDSGLARADSPDENRPADRRNRLTLAAKNTGKTAPSGLKMSVDFRLRKSAFNRQAA